MIKSMKKKKKKSIDLYSGVGGGKNTYNLFMFTSKHFTIVFTISRVSQTLWIVYADISIK